MTLPVYPTHPIAKCIPSWNTTVSLVGFAPPQTNSAWHWSVKLYEHWYYMYYNVLDVLKRMDLDVWNFGQQTIQSEVISSQIQLLRPCN